MDNRTEQLADGVWRVEVSLYINAFVLANDGHGDAEGLTLVDTGTRSAGPRLVRSVRMLGLAVTSVSDVLLTHWHRDHTGSAARLAASSAAPRVWVGKGDLAVVRGVQAPPVPDAPDTTRLGRLVGRRNRPGAAVPSAEGVRDGRRFEAAGGVEVVATPGHTVGHVAYLLPERGVLLAGDSLLNVGWLSRGPRFVCTALSAMQATGQRLAGLDYDVLAVAHGPAVRDHTRERVARLTSSV